MKVARVAIALLLAAGCASGPSRPTRGRDAPPPPDLLLRFERTGCYGFCPAYVVEVDRDGALFYEGVAHVSRCRKASARLGPDALAALRSAIARASFLQTPEHCCGCMNLTDQPSAILTVVDGAAPKTIEDYHGCDATPKVIRDLEVELDTILGTERWVGRDERGSCSFW